MRNIDEKFAVNDQGQIYKKSNGEILDESEPLFLLRARDLNALDTLIYYQNICRLTDCTEYQLDGVATMIQKFEDFKFNHFEKMKQPGSTRGE